MLSRRPEEDDVPRIHDHSPTSCTRLLRPAQEKEGYPSTAKHRNWRAASPEVLDPCPSTKSSNSPAAPRASAPPFSSLSSPAPCSEERQRGERSGRLAFPITSSTMWSTAFDGTWTTGLIAWRVLEQESCGAVERRASRAPPPLRCCQSHSDRQSLVAKPLAEWSDPPPQRGASAPTIQHGDRQSLQQDRAPEKKVPLGWGVCWWCPAEGQNAPNVGHAPGHKKNSATCG